MSTVGRTQPNALARESSPYLRQHAHNPVDWLPWGKAALALAHQKDLPILLSIGYSTCHWCHVMAHESFDDPEVAAVMNRHFISIKVDREERPDLDAIYMAAVTAMTGRGGWPLNVFLMPDGTPFFGGTYFPPAHRQGAVSWPMLLERIAELWADPAEREKLTVSAKAITDHVAGQQQIAPTTGSRVVSVGDRMTAARQAFSRRFDTARGGFSPAPKFPMPPVIDFMYFDQLAGNQPFGDSRTAESSGQMATETLTAMARGGIFDQFGGGFHRYSVDDRWHLPHFEKMLYDNALLAATYADAAAITNKKAFARVAADTLDYLLRDLRHADGGFFSAEDADSPVPGHPDRPAQEGAFYVWTLDELNAALDPSLAPMVAYRYGIQPTGNVRSDPHGEFAEKNIPYQAHRLSDTARIYPETAPHIAESLDQCRAQLLSVRNERPRPHRDEKILTGWNGLAISALAVADARLQRSDYGNAAAVTARFIYTHLYDPSNQMLYRRWYDGDRAIAGMLDDYGYLLQGLLDLFNVDSDPFWLDWALALADGLINRFQNPKSGQLFMTDASVGNDLVVRPTDTVDGVVPAAGGVAAAALIRLSDLVHQAAYAESAHHYISAMSGLIEAEPAAAPTTIMAMALNQWPPFQAFADATRPKAAILARQILASPIPGQLMVRWHSSEQRQSLANRIPAVHTTATTQAAIVVCSQRICHPPVNRTDQLAGLIAMEIGDLSVKT